MLKMFWNDIELFFYDWYLRHIKKPKCLVCKEIATLQLDCTPVLWICENCAKKIHDANLSDKTLGDAYHEAFSGERVQSTIMFHQNMDKHLTEKEYQKAVDGYKAFISVMEEELND